MVNKAANQSECISYKIFHNLHIKIETARLNLTIIYILI